MTAAAPSSVSSTEKSRSGAKFAGNTRRPWRLTTNGFIRDASRRRRWSKRGPNKAETQVGAADGGATTRVVSCFGGEGTVAGIDRRSERDLALHPSADPHCWGSEEML